MLTILRSFIIETEKKLRSLIPFSTRVKCRKNGFGSIVTIIRVIDEIITRGKARLGILNLNF